MKRNGFTLVELLVVVILIAAIVLLVLPNITNSVKNYNTNVDKTTFNIIKEATKLYVSDNANSFMKRSENTYCVSLNKLIEHDYLKNTIEYNNQDITNTKVVKVTYDNGFKYELVNTSDCEKIVKFDTICEADKEQLYAANSLDVGYKYNCKVDPDKPAYTFYILSYNDENNNIKKYKPVTEYGNFTSDKENAKSVNLIMDSNIRIGGEPVKEQNPTEEQKGFVAWLTYDDYIKSNGTEQQWENQENNKGPITAMDFLVEATKKWTNLKQYDLDKYNCGNTCEKMAKIYNTYARMPYAYIEIELYGVEGVNNLYLYDYLAASNNNIQVNLVNDVYGYWTANRSSANQLLAWNVSYSGSMYPDMGITPDDIYGVRPVITLDL